MKFQGGRHLAPYSKKSCVGIIKPTAVKLHTCEVHTYEVWADAQTTDIPTNSPNFTHMNFTHMKFIPMKFETSHIWSSLCLKLHMCEVPKLHTYEVWNFTHMNFTHMKFIPMKFETSHIWSFHRRKLRQPISSCLSVFLPDDEQTTPGSISNTSLRSSRTRKLNALP